MFKIKKWILFVIFAFLIIGIAGAFQYLIGDSEDAIILDVALPSAYQSFLNTTFPQISLIEVQGDTTIIHIQSGFINLFNNQFIQLERLANSLEVYIKLARINNLPITIPICQKANDGTIIGWVTNKAGNQYIFIPITNHPICIQIVSVQDQN